MASQSLPEKRGTADESAVTAAEDPFLVLALSAIANKATARLPYLEEQLERLEREEAFIDEQIRTLEARKQELGTERSRALLRKASEELVLRECPEMDVPKLVERLTGKAVEKEQHGAPAPVDATKALAELLDGSASGSPLAEAGRIQALGPAPLSSVDWGDLSVAPGFEEEPVLLEEPSAEADVSDDDSIGLLGFDDSDAPGASAIRQAPDRLARPSGKGEYDYGF